MESVMLAPASLKSASREFASREFAYREFWESLLPGGTAIANLLVKLHVDARGHLAKGLDDFTHPRSLLPFASPRKKMGDVRISESANQRMPSRVTSS
jgi:hypothetical protein